MSVRVHRFETADRLGVGDGLDRRQRDVGGDPRVFGAAAEGEQPQPRHQDHPRHRVELAFRHRLACVVPGEIGVVVGCKPVDRVAHRGLEHIEPADFGRRHDQRMVLGADRMVRRGDAGLAITAELGAIDIVEHRRADAKIQDEPLIDAGLGWRSDGAGPAQDRRDLARFGDRSGLSGGDEHRLSVVPQPLLRQRYRGNHALIRLSRSFTAGEDAVLQQHQPLDRRIGFKDLGCRFRQQETRHDVWHQPQPPAVQFGAPPAARRARLPPYPNRCP